jgi:hypothetical protein
MTTRLDDLDPCERAVFEWQYRMAGGFKSALFDAISKADSGNLARLRLGFPTEVDGFLAFRDSEGWWQSVQHKVIK